MICSLLFSNDIRQNEKDNGRDNGVVNDVYTEMIVSCC